MRAILMLVGIVALVIVVLMALGMLRIEQQSDASLPSISFDVEGGKMPTFKAETGTVAVRSSNTSVELPTVQMQNTTISLPTIEVEKAGNGAAPAAAQ